MSIELSQVMKEKGRMFDWSDRVVKNLELSEEDIAISNAVDAFAKKIGETGVASIELSQYLTKVVEPEVYNAPSELLDLMFEMDSLGEFDDVGIFTNPVNRLNAQESAARTGNVDKSYIDFTKGTKESVHLQIDTEIKMSDLRQNGFKSIALLTQYATEALNNKKFYSIFNKVDSLITSPSAQGFEVTGALTVTAMDDFSGYLLDNGVNPLIVGLSTDLRGIKNMAGYDKFLSENMKDALNMGAVLKMYDGVPLAQISAGKKLADGSNLLTAKKLFGFADKIGQYYTRGSLRVLQTPDNNREVIGLKFTGFEFVYGITKLEKIAKLTIK